MHIVLQFPIIDLRSALPGCKGKLESPDWANLSLDAKPFIRNFGAVKERNTGGSTEWPGESFYCDMHSVLQYNDLHKQGYNIDSDIRSSVIKSYRRYFSDGYFVGKAETGFVDNTEKLALENNCPAESINLEDVLKHYVSLPVKVRDKEIKLYRAGRTLAKEFYLKTTSDKNPPEEDIKLAVAGEIVVLLTYAKNHAINLPEHAFFIEEFPLPSNLGSLRVFGYKLKFEGYSIKSWIIETPFHINKSHKSVKDVLHNLRINLQRIHLEKETIRILLNSIKRNIIEVDPYTAEAKTVKTYIKKTGEKLFRKERFTLNQQNILDYALHSEESLLPGSFVSLQDGVKYFEDHFSLDNVERLLAGMKRKMILFICASPKGGNPLNFGREFTQIKDSLQAASDRYNYKIEIEPSVKKDDFLKILHRYEPDFLHMSMHGSLTEGLYFEDKDQERLPMAVEEFSKTIKAFSDTHKPSVVILSACNSKNHAEAIKDCCQYVVGTKTAFPAEAGIIYASKFYTTLFEKNSQHIPACHEAARIGLQYGPVQFEPVKGLPVYDIPELIESKN